METPASYQVTFNVDGTVAIVADCNNAAGTYTDKDGALTIAVGPMTAGCLSGRSRAATSSSSCWARLPATSSPTASCSST